MQKFTRKDRASLERILAHLERAHAYLFRPEIAIAQRGTIAPTTLHYLCDNTGSTLYEVEKEYGSDLTGLDTGIRGLRVFLDQAPTPCHIMVNDE